MAARNGNVVVIPSARRLMSSLRDMGYDTPAAIADLVDNSIDAEARRVDITVAERGARSWIRITDNGVGMTPTELDEAMRYGASRDYDAHSLGHFGLGLKTASLSQCRRLTVASGTSPRGRVHVRRWDLDRVARLDAWELERLTPGRCPEALIEPLRQCPGTVVLWEGLDRVLSLARPDGAVASRLVHQLQAEIAQHLAMVFHRFIAGEVFRRGRRLNLTINETPISAWDPYAREEPRTRRLERQAMPFRHNGSIASLSVQPYVLPTQLEFSSAEAHAAAAGPRRWNRQQGLYIYRRNRMIQSGGWNRLRTLDEHSKLARVAVDIPSGAEDAFKINVAKMAVTLPADVRPALGAVVSGVVSRAQDAYRQRVALVKPTAGVHASTNGHPESSEGVRWRLGDHWPVLIGVLENELEEHPELLHRVMVALANADVGSAGGAVPVSD